MYKSIVARQARRTYQLLSEGEYEQSLRGMARNVRHTYLGAHPCGGTRHSVEGVRRWFERAFRLFPGLRHDVTEVVVAGWPWNTVVAVQWAGFSKSPKLEDPLVLDGVHIVRFRWGRVTEVTGYPDTAKMEAYCRRMAEQGIEEAAAPPIED